MRTALLSCLLASAAFAQGELSIPLVKADLSKADPAAAVWKTAPTTTVSLMAQPMVTPRPEATTTSEVRVQAVHDGTRAAFRLTWKDDGTDWAGILGTFSDAAALQFPVGTADSPPPVMMGAKDLPVHIFHWRAQYQRDAEKGTPTPKDLYPNLNVDMYPMEFHDMGALGHKPDDNRDQFSPGRATGNPQAFSKTGVDEIIAEGFSTSSVQKGNGSVGKATWANGEWTLVISRPLKTDGGSVLTPGGKSFVAFAVWQGGKQEVGSRKSLTMAWTPVSVGK